ncbi:MAG: MltA domain-containing protein [Desulfobacula sp.]
MRTANKMVLKHKKLMCLIIILCVFCGCTSAIREEKKEAGPLRKLKPGEYPEFTDRMNYQGLLDSIDNSLIYFKKVPAERQYAYEKETYTAGHMIRSLEVFKTYLKANASPNGLNQFIKDRYIVYEAAGNEKSEVLFTGYYEPTYEGRLKKTQGYPYPIFLKPNDLLEIDLSAFSDQYKGHKRLTARVNDATKRVVPYYTRKEITALEDFQKRAEPLVWLKSQVDGFFLEVQGSGRIDLGGGQLLRVHYDTSNGRAYSSVGKYLIDKNEISKENMSMQAIRQWLEAHPDRTDEVLNYNQSYVFFRKETDGPYGSLGVKVTAFRSIATDNDLFPRGALCFIQTRLPGKDRMDSQKEWENASFFVLNQDTGGAIKGPARADLFCGNGNYAEFTAGYMKHYGKLFYLVLRPDKE